MLGIGISDFKEIIDTNTFYVDKTYFIEEWFSNTDEVTLITRPRRFGKTLTMSMLEYFLSDRYKDQAYLFESLYVFNCENKEKYRKIQGSSPVIKMSFAGIRCDSFEDAFEMLKMYMQELYLKHIYILESDILSENEKNYFNKVLNREVTEREFKYSLKNLSDYLQKYTGKKVYILLDECDTPIKAAYTDSYWEKFAGFILLFFEKSFKHNKSLERAILMGMTRVAKESSIISGFNNVVVKTIVDKRYNRCFGFTEKETFNALDMYELSDKKEEVKRYYGGYGIEKKEDIYNPWSVVNYLTNRSIKIYWAKTSSSIILLIEELIKKGNYYIKQSFEELLKGNAIEEEIDTEIVYKQLDYNPYELWSLMVASGYLRVCDIRENDCILALTNKEVICVFEKMVDDWFAYDDGWKYFIEDMFKGDYKEMSRILKRVLLFRFDYFNNNKHSSEFEAENFYHGFVLGLVVKLKDKYVVDSNRESGFGRYDIMIKPRDVSMAGVIIEFKVYDEDEEETIKDTVESALKQIEDKNYEQKLKDEGINKIYKYGIVFCGKKCKIGIPTKE